MTDPQRRSPVVSNLAVVAAAARDATRALELLHQVSDPWDQAPALAGAGHWPAAAGDERGSALADEVVALAETGSPGTVSTAHRQRDQWLTDLAGLLAVRFPDHAGGSLSGSRPRTSAAG